MYFRYRKIYGESMSILIFQFSFLQNNDGVYMVELESDSHSEIMGIVEAYFTQNIVQVNKGPSTFCNVP